MRNFRELLVWQKSHELALEVYRRTSRFPADEDYERLNIQVNEVKRILNSFIQSLA